MKEEWLFSGAYVPSDAETTAALVAEIKRLIDVVGGMALTQRTWVGLTDEEINDCLVSADPCECLAEPEARQLVEDVEAKLKDKNT